MPGWRTKRKLVVIESDDWGSIRMPSTREFNYLKTSGLNVDSGDSARYNRFDTLANSDDLNALFETLSKFKDINENNPIITAVSLTSNPDFEKIRENNFQEYFQEPFTKTLERYNQGDAIKLWKEGKQKKLFHPEFHGREHLNISSWMRALSNNNKEALLAFEYGCWSFKPKNTLINYQAAFDIEYPLDLTKQKTIITEGLNLFKDIHGYNAKFFVPPNGPFNSKLEFVLAENKISFISMPKIHKEPQGNNKFKTKFYWLGKTNKLKQTYLTRNAFFEPNFSGKGFSVNDCLQHIDLAFKFKKPAVISTHRVNYIGVKDEQNRIHGNKELTSLITLIMEKWPEVEFITSSQLGDLITKSQYDKK